MAGEEQAREKFGTWATLELFGHVRLQGYVSERDLFGTTMVQIDVIGEDGGQGETRYYGAAAVYSCRPCSEEEIKAEIEQRRQWAARRAALMERPALSARVTEETEDNRDGVADGYAAGPDLFDEREARAQGIPF